MFTTQKQRVCSDRSPLIGVSGIACLAGVITFLVFVRSLTCGFVNMDDPDYVLNNALVRGLDWNHLVAAFSTVHAGFWMPLTWISLAVDYHFWGLNPAGYHLTNIVLHALNTGLVVLVADKLCPAKADSGYTRQLQPLILLAAGLVWGVHPLRVESVAWVTERKDVLNGLFFLGSLVFYTRYVRSRTIQDHRCLPDRDYLWSLILFVLSLLAKPVSVVLPFMLLVIDWYPLGRLNRVTLRTSLLEKVPYFLCSGIMAVATLAIARQSNILASYDNLSVFQRLAVSGNAIVEYCRFMLYPGGILPLHIIDAALMTTYAMKGMTFAVLSIFGVYLLRKKRWPVAVLFCFLLPLLPVLALFQNGIQAFAARFTYLPAIAPALLAAFGVGSLLRSDGNVRAGFLRQAVVFFLITLVIAYGITTWRFIGIWQSTETVWSRIIDRQPSGRAFKERGQYYLSAGKYAAAEHDLTTAIRFAERVNLAEGYKLFALRGVAFLGQHRYQDSVADFSRAILQCPDPNYYYYRGKALELLGKIREAETDFHRAGGAVGPIEWGNSACR